MKITIEYNSHPLRKLTSKQIEEIEVDSDANFIKVVELLQREYGKEFKNTVIDKNTGKIKFLILIDGISIVDLNYKLKDKNKINFLTLVTGG